MTNIDCKQISEINAILFPQFPSGKVTDVAIVLGFGIFSPSLAAKAAEHYAKGEYPRIIVTGGVVVRETPEYLHLRNMVEKAGISLPEEGETEAAYIRRLLCDYGVPEASIAVEDASQNTGQNFENSLPLLGDSASCTVIGCSSTVPRSIATARKYITSDSYVLNALPVDPFGLSQENWHQTPFATQFVLSEWDKLFGPNNYFDLGHCIRIDLKDEITRASTLLPSLPAADGSAGHSLQQKTLQ